MPKKEEQQDERLVAIVAPGTKSLVPYGLALSNNAPQTKTEERILMEQRKQQQVIEAQKQKIMQALRSIDEINRYADDMFFQSVTHQDAIRQAAQGKAYQPLVEEFHRYALTLESQHFYRILDSGAHTIGLEVSRSLYMPDTPESDKRSRLQKLLGG